MGEGAMISMRHVVCVVLLCMLMGVVVMDARTLTSHDKEQQPSPPEGEQEPSSSGGEHGPSPPKVDHGPSPPEGEHGPNSPPEGEHGPSPPEGDHGPSPPEGHDHGPSPPEGDHGHSPPKGEQPSPHVGEQPTPPSEPTPTPSTPTPTPPALATPPSEPTPTLITPPALATPPSELNPTPTTTTPPSEPTSTPTPPASSIPPSESTPTLPSEPTPTPTPPTSPPSSSPKKAKCKDKKYNHCYNMEHVCPRSCPGDCEVDCDTCKPICKCDRPGSVCQDPRFIGGDGITFYFHGKKDRDFCLLSDFNLHINAHFIGRRNHNMKRDFTWVQSIGILFDNHQIFVSAQKTATWDDSIDRLVLAFNGQPIFLPEREGVEWKPTDFPSISFRRSGNTNGVTIEVEGKFKFMATVVPITEEESRVHNYGITKGDCFAHLDIGFKFYSLSDEVNGVLGQTYRRDYVSRVKMGVTMPIMGGGKEFVSTNLFATDCAVARFLGSSSSGGEVYSEMAEYASLSCGSGMNGQGVVCKR